MLNSAIVRIVDFSARRRWRVVAAGIVLAAAAATYDVARFSITTDTESLISPNLPWRQREAVVSEAFPQKGISVVITAASSENAEQAANALAQDLSKHTDLFRSVDEPGSGKFFEHNGLLLEPLPDVKKSVDALSGAQFFIGELAGDASLRGAMKVLSLATDGVRGGEIKLDQLVWPLSLADGTLNDVLAGKPATFSWRELVEGSEPQATKLQRFIGVQPVLNFSDLQPGRQATDGIRRSAADLKLGEKFGAKVELTGTVPMNDDQFSVIRQSSLRDTLAALVGALIILWLALRSWKIVAAACFSLMVGLAATAALGLAMVGSFNLISIHKLQRPVRIGSDRGLRDVDCFHLQHHPCSGAVGYPETSGRGRFSWLQQPCSAG
jgi:predicted RND superfamily exporter protein